MPSGQRGRGRATGIACAAVATLTVLCSCDVFLLDTAGELEVEQPDIGRDVPGADAADDGERDDDADDVPDGEETTDPPCTTHIDCNDGIGCTQDRCAEGSRRCSRAVNDGWCPLGHRCSFGVGCVVNMLCGGDEDCNDGDDCTVDRCIRGVECLHDPRDRDGDGIGDSACTRQPADCDDTRADVRPLFPEACDDGVDNNCDGLTDHQADACDARDNDACDRAARLWPNLGPIRGDSSAFDDTPAEGLCGGDGPDAWYVFTIDDRASVTLDTIGSSFDTVLRLFTGCGGIEIACNDDRNHRPAEGSRIVHRGLLAGTYWIAVGGKSAGDRGRHRLAVLLGPPEVEPGNCDRVLDVTDGGTVIGFLGTRGEWQDFDGGSCGGGGLHPAGGQQERFRVALAAGATLWISSAGTPIPSVLYARSDGCQDWFPDEIACAEGPAYAGTTLTISGRSGTIDFALDTDRADRSGWYRIEVRP